MEFPPNTFSDEPAILKGAKENRAKLAKLIPNNMLDLEFYVQQRIWLAICTGKTNEKEILASSDAMLS